MAVSKLARLCIVGSDKGDAALPGEDSPAEAALRELEELDPAGEPREETARKYLLASGIATLRTLDLAAPRPDGETDAPALEERLPEGPNPRALFVRRYPLEVVSWLRRQGRRLPCVFLPEAVQWAAPGGRDEIWPVLGLAGIRLCQDNPAWRRLLAACEGRAAEEAREEELPSWEDASPAVRRLLLRRLRARDPGAGRELAAPLLRKQFSRNRHLLYEFRQGLSAEDIPLLEECAQKKWDASELHPAHVLLSLLPESAFSRSVADADILVWKRDGLELKADVADAGGTGRKDWMGKLPPDVFLTACSLDWWISRSGRNGAELAPLLARSDFIHPVGMRIFLEDRKDWLRRMLEATLEDAPNTSGVRRPQGFLGALATVMLPPEEVADWLRRLLRHEALNFQICEMLAALMLLRARFPLPRDIWSDYVAAVGRRAEAVVRAGAKNGRFSWSQSFWLLWGAERETCVPDAFAEWTRGEFRETIGQNSVALHLAWEIPLDLLERLAEALLLPSDPSLFKGDREELEEIRAFRARIEQA